MYFIYFLRDGAGRGVISDFSWGGGQRRLGEQSEPNQRWCSQGEGGEL